MAPDRITMFFSSAGLSFAFSTDWTWGSNSSNGDGGRSGTDSWSTSNFSNYNPVDTGDDGESPFEKWLRWWTRRQKSIDAILERARNLKPVRKVLQLARRRLERRTEPRWSSLRWKAKT